MARQPQSSDSSSGYLSPPDKSESMPTACAAFCAYVYIYVGVHVYCIILSLQV